MKRIIAILCLLAGIAQAQSVIIVTNNILALPTVSTSVVAGTVRITEYLRQGANAIDINNNTGQVFVTDIRDGAPIFSFNLLGTNVVATNGQIRYAFTLTAGPTYDVRTFIYPQDGSPRYASGIYSLTVTSAPSAASVTVTNGFAPVNNITNIIQNIVQSNNYFTTSGVSSVSFTGAVDGAIVLAAGNNITIAQTNRTFNISSTASGGGGLSYFVATTGTSTQVGSFLQPTSTVGIADQYGIFFGTNRSVSIDRSNGGSDGGNARGAGSVDLQGYLAGSLQTRAAASQVVSAPWSFMAAAYRSTISSASGGNVILGGENGNSSAISAGEGSAIIAHASGTISGAGGNNVIMGGDSANISSSLGNNLILGGRVSQTIANSALDSALLGNYDCDIGGTTYGASIITSEGSVIAVTNSSFITDAFIIGSQNSRIFSTGTDLTRNSSIISGWATTNAGRGSIAMGYRARNTLDGNLVYASYDAGSTTFTPAKSNTATFRVPNGFGINTNNPQESLHVDGRIQITGIKIYASGTNLFLTDGATYTNRINVTPE